MRAKLVHEEGDEKIVKIIRRAGMGTRPSCHRLSLETGGVTRIGPKDELPVASPTAKMEACRSFVPARFGETRQEREPSIVAAEQPAFWVAYTGSEEKREPLIVGVPGVGEALAVFSFREEADLYLLLCAAKDCLRVGSLGAGALLSLLRSPCSCPDWVVLDPMPQWDAGPMLRLACLRRSAFVDLLSERAARADR